MNQIPPSAQPPAEAAAAEQTDAAQPRARSTLRFLISCAVVFMAGAGAILLIPTSTPAASEALSPASSPSSGWDWFSSC